MLVTCCFFSRKSITTSLTKIEIILSILLKTFNFKVKVPKIKFRINSSKMLFFREDKIRNLLKIMPLNSEEITLIRITIQLL